MHSGDIYDYFFHNHDFIMWKYEQIEQMPLVQVQIFTWHI